MSRRPSTHGEKHKQPLYAARFPVSSKFTPGVVCKLTVGRITVRVRVTGQQYTRNGYGRRIAIRSEEPASYGDRLPCVRPERLEVVS